MLHYIKKFYGGKLGATEGAIGHIKDFYFDDQSWAIRYLVADTGGWLTGRLVLLSPHSFGLWDEEGKTLQVKLRRKQIEDSPSPEAHRPVSRQYEVEFYRYYGWPAYWEGTDVWGLGGFPLAAPPVEVPRESRPKFHHRDDKHLRSTHAVTGYSIQATDGTLGQVTGFRIDDQSWTIQEIVAETGSWFSGKEILIPVKQVQTIRYEDARVITSLTQADLKRTAENKVVRHRTKPPVH